MDCDCIVIPFKDNSSEYIVTGKTSILPTLTIILTEYVIWIVYCTVHMGPPFVTGNRNRVPVTWLRTHWQTRCEWSQLMRGYTASEMRVASSSNLRCSGHRNSYITARRPAVGLYRTDVLVQINELAESYLWCYSDSALLTREVRELMVLY